MFKRQEMNPGREKRTYGSVLKLTAAGLFRPVSLILLMITTWLGLMGCSAPPPASVEPVSAITPTLAPVTSGEMRKVVAVFSYEPDFWAAVDEAKGLVEGLAELGYVEGQNVEITRIYMRTKTVNVKQEQMAAEAEKVATQVKEIKPEVMMVFDDDALRHVGPKFLGSDLPIAFGGINGDPARPDYTPTGPLVDSLEHPGHNITGVLERNAFSAGFDVVGQIVPGVKTAVVVSDNSGAVTVQIDQLINSVKKNTQIEIVDTVFNNDFNVVKKAVLDYQDKVDIIYFWSPYSLQGENGDPVPIDEAMNWLVKNSRRPGFSTNEALVEQGELVGVVVDLVKQGYHAGLRAGKILNGEKPPEMPIVDPVANRIILNLARADQLGIKIPFEVLESADKVYKVMTAYPEYKMSTE